MEDPAREARNDHVPSTCDTHGLSSLPRVSRESVLAWWALGKNQSKEGSFSNSEKQGTKMTVIVVAGTVIVELVAMEEPTPQSL